MRYTRMVLAIALAVAVGVVGREVWNWMDRPFRTSFRSGAPARYPNLHDRLVSFPVPKTAKWLHTGSYYRGLEWGEVAVIECRSADVKLLMSHLANEERYHDWSVSKTDRLGMKNEEGFPNWWDPNSCRRFVAASVGKPTEILRMRLLIDLDDPDHPILYIQSYAVS